jgi:F0F1-type ATP synthase membrane subunit c/vacuolar-type H+-ATPase subunit K
MHPIIVGSALERFTRNEWSAPLLLLQAIVFFGLVDELLLHSLLFSVSVSFLLVCDFRLLVEIVFSLPLWTEDTLV